MGTNDVVAPTERDLQALDDSKNVESKVTIQDAQDGDAADRSLTVRQALKKYKKAVCWAMILSTSLIMEGYDVVIVSPLFNEPADCLVVDLWTNGGGRDRSPPSTARPNSSTALAPSTRPRETNSSRPPGNRV